jgi:Icc-related predicted phosphoesterase
MPQGLDLLISHGPPRGILDKNRGWYSCGSRSLLEAVLDNRPKHTVVGHIHEGYGHFNLDGQKFYNVSQLDDMYRLRRGPTEILL